MLKNLIYLTIILVLGLSAAIYWSPDDAPISGVTPEDISSSVSDRVESTQDGIIVTSIVSQPSDASTSVVVQYVIVMNVNPDLFSLQPQTQEEADEQQHAFLSLRGSIADVLALSQKHLLVNPTVAQVRVTVIFLDGEVLDGAVVTKDLKAIPQGSTPEEWLSVIALTPASIVPQAIWEAILSLPEVQKTIQAYLDSQE